MADPKRRRTSARPRSTFGSVAYDLDYYGDVVAVPAPRYAPQPQAEPKSEPRVTDRPHERARVKVKVRQQQAVSPFAVIGFLAAAAIAVVLLLGYVQLNSVYAETVQLQSQLTELQSEAADLEALYEETFDMETLEEAVARDGTLTTPSSSQTVYIDLSEPDNAVVYDAGSGTGISGLLRAVSSLFASALEYFR